MYAIEDLHRLMENGAEESLYLEFKGAKALDRSEAVRAEISKDISAFANADGGVLIYGIAEENHMAAGIDAIDGSVYTKEWLEDVIGSNVHRPISGLQIFPIRLNQEKLDSIYIVRVPASPEAPHMSKDNRYYVRRNFKAERLQEYEVRALYERRTTAILELGGWSIAISDNKDLPGHVEIEIYIPVYNSGTIAESNYNVNAYVDPLPHYVTGRIDKVLYSNHDLIRLFDSRIKFTAASNRSIFPQETIRGLTFILILPEDRITEFCKGTIIELAVYFSGGVHKSEIDLREAATQLLEKLSLKRRHSEPDPYEFA